MSPRFVVIGLWSLLTGLSVLVEPVAGAQAGLFAPSVTISPAVLIILTLTPAETIVTLGVRIVRGKFGVPTDE